MNVKEKAIKLIEKFYPYAKAKSSGFLVSNEDIYVKSAIECSIIAVDEIINSEALQLLDFGLSSSQTDFWQDVKKELELLK